jgi:hypothetical protein
LDINRISFGTTSRSPIPVYSGAIGNQPNDFNQYSYIEIRAPPALAAQFNALSVQETSDFVVFAARVFARRAAGIRRQSELIRAATIGVQQTDDFRFRNINVLEGTAESQNSGNRLSINIRLPTVTDFSIDAAAKFIASEQFASPIPDDHQNVIFYVGNDENLIVFENDNTILNILLPILDDVIMSLLQMRFVRPTRFDLLFRHGPYLEQVRQITALEPENEAIAPVEDEEEAQPPEQRMRLEEVLDARRRRQEALMIFLQQQNTIPGEITARTPFPTVPREITRGLETLV